MRPSYGLAEATVFVTAGTWSESSDGSDAATDSELRSGAATNSASPDCDSDSAWLDSGAATDSASPDCETTSGI